MTRLHNPLATPWTLLQAIPATVITDVVKPARDAGKATGEASAIPFTPVSLIEEISSKIPDVANRCFNTKIAVLYTVEWALWLLSKGFKDITVITRTYDPGVEKVVNFFATQSGVKGFVYMTEEKVKKMKFDVVVGNPPYSINVGGEGRTSGTKIRLYAQFFDRIFEKAPTYAIIIPSNWIGRVKDAVRRKILTDTSVKWLIDTTEHFDDKIKGTPTCAVIKDVTYNSSTKFVAAGGMVRSAEASTITTLNASETAILASKLVEARTTMATMWARNVNTGITRSCSQLSVSPTQYPVVLITGPAGAPADIGYITTKNTKQKFVNHIKVVMNTNASVSSIGAIKIVPAGMYTTDSIVFFPADTEQQAHNIKQYLDSTIVRFIVRVVRNSHGNSQAFFSKVPTVDFSRTWTDQELYQHFNLTQDEIDLIERTVGRGIGRNIKVMNLDTLDVETIE